MEQWTPTGKPTGKFRDRGRTRDWSARYLCRFPFSVIDFLWRRSVKCRSLVFPAPFFFFFACVFLNYPLISFFPSSSSHSLAFLFSERRTRKRAEKQYTNRGRSLHSFSLICVLLLCQQRNSTMWIWNEWKKLGIISKDIFASVSKFRSQTHSNLSRDGAPFFNCKIGYWLSK